MNQGKDVNKSQAARDCCQSIEADDSPARNSPVEVEYPHIVQWLRLQQESRLGREL